MTRERDTRDQELKAARKRRVPLHEQRHNILTIDDQDPNYVYRVVNDLDGRVDKFKRAGYEIVTRDHKVGDGGDADKGNNNSVGSGTRINVGSGRQGVLMRIRKEDYEEDQLAKQQDITYKENLLIRKKKPRDEADSEGNYGEVSIDR